MDGLICTNTTVARDAVVGIATPAKRADCRTGRCSPAPPRCCAAWRSLGGKLPLVRWYTRRQRRREIRSRRARAWCSATRASSTADPPWRARAWRRCARRSGAWFWCRRRSCRATATAWWRTPALEGRNTFRVPAQAELLSSTCAVPQRWLRCSRFPICARQAAAGAGRRQQSAVHPRLARRGTDTSAPGIEVLGATARARAPQAGETGTISCAGRWPAAMSAWKTWC